ncbi:hypothetical protein HK098_001861 [Nowakowskiella sp. JEL0407]|nr:hypothetical protein HK098_001861 [Nowakowskiella sp. JEL0407]
MTSVPEGKYYAAKMAIDKGSKTKESQLYLLEILDTLEKGKKLLSEHEAITNDVVGIAHIENFAMRIFNSADEEDMSGKASKKTAMGFLAASQFLELLRVFGDVDTDIEEKIKYAKFKAVDILKALKEGRVPEPGVPNADQSANVPDLPAEISSPQPAMQAYTPQQPDIVQPQVSNFDSFNTPPVPSFPQHTPFNQQAPTYQDMQQFNQPSASVQSFNNQQSYNPHSPYNPQQMQPIGGFIDSENTPTFQTFQQQPQPSAPFFNVPAMPKSASQEISPFDMDHKSISEAQKLARYAISALQYDDIPTALSNFRNAIAMLEKFERQ